MLVRLPPTLLLAVVLHTAVFPQLRILGVTANGLLLLAVAAGITGGPERGAAVAFGCGLLADCFLQTPFGLSGLVFALVAYGVGTFQTGVLHAAWWIPPLTAAVASAAGTVGYVGLGVVVGQDQLLSMWALQVAGVVAVLHAVLAPLAVRAMRWAIAGDGVPGLLLR